ncbi:molybdenum cofactor biosynthesis protein [Siccirubricoccus deserti]|uniref:Competence/damage-inducible protein A n=1 Tax=Siccirubricoccus deserti TaxID=2013562 RepID=A0A9X0UFJ0_9PROT|nr:competence/damage-inducible protein A [Siccirubricoccus deserti]MBC4018011.1 competence/damage-inducible protein A [Siccirubricoccus deserti]GGC62273.1 molybdenum cofactor biosynthesis protein [Siccirubricoccus deserti]
MTASPTACLLVIGNEVLSGRTRDANLQYLATRLGEIGIPLREARVIPDVPETIIATVNECRAKFTHVFTTGGIGPTHDDITSECVARAFGVPWEVHEETRAIMAADYARRSPPVELNAARLRMATLPRGAVPIRCTETTAPGFSMANVHVMAGVPRIMRSMFEALAPTLEGGAPILSRSVHADFVYEGQIADGLSAIQAEYPALDLGSYPYYRRRPDGGMGGGVALVAKGTDPTAVAAAAQAMYALLARFGEAAEGEPAPE